MLGRFAQVVEWVFSGAALLALVPAGLLLLKNGNGSTEYPTVVFLMIVAAILFGIGKATTFIIRGKATTGAQPRAEASTIEDEEIDLNDMSEEEEQRQAETVQSIMALCKIGQMFASDLEDSDEETKNDANQRIDKQLARIMPLVASLTDDFYRMTALHQVCKLLVNAGRIEDARGIFMTIDDDFFIEKILADCPELASVSKPRAR